MKPVEVLQEAWANERLVRFYIKSKPTEKFGGYVVGLSDNLVLFHVTDGGHKMMLNGYSTFPLRELRRVRLLDDYERFEERVFFLKGITPVPQPDLLLEDLPGLLSSANTIFPLLTVHTERKEPDACWIGRVAKVGKKSLHLKKISPAAHWIEKVEKFSYKDITRVEFGGGYEESLWMVAEAERKAARLLDDL